MPHVSPGSDGEVLLLEQMREYALHSQYPEQIARLRRDLERSRHDSNLRRDLLTARTPGDESLDQRDGVHSQTRPV